MRFVPSKQLLLHGEIRDDNAAYNGEVYVILGTMSLVCTGPYTLNSLEDRNQ